MAFNLSNPDHQEYTRPNEFSSQLQPPNSETGKTMDIQVLDFTKICRTCLGFDNEMRFLFTNEPEQITELADIRKMIADCTIYPVVNDDHFPNKICAKCISDVKIAYEFKTQCEKAFEMLSSVIESYQEDPKADHISYPETVFVKSMNIKEENAETASNPLSDQNKKTDEFQSSLAQYKCDVCSKAFPQDVHLRKHMSTAHPAVTYVCNVCNKNCVNSVRLKRHISLSHPDKSIEDSDIANVIKCDDCLEIFETKENLREHVCRNDDTFDPTNVESILGLNDNKADIEIISDDDFFNDTGESYEDTIEQSNNSDEDEEYVTLADLRETKSKRSSIRTKISSIKKEHRCEVCNKVFTRSTHLKRHSYTHAANKPFSCTECHKGFTRLDHLNLHMAHHSPIKPHICSVCNRGFIRAEHLRRHFESRHGEKVPSIKTEFCTICGKGFTTAKYLQIHMKSHLDKTWSCKFCPDTFSSKPELTEHSKTHTNEKPFLCSECGLRFVRNDYLVIHMRRHKGEKPYKCKFCSKGFPRATDLNVHERYHTGEKTHLCTVCGKGFQRAYNLLVHMRVHTGERPYKCPHCSKCFAQGNDLKAHVRRHTGERFKCDICGDGFIQGYHLTQHKRNAHGIDMKSHIRRVAKFTTPTEQQQQMEAIQQLTVEPEISENFVDDDGIPMGNKEEHDETLQTVIKIEDTSVEQQELDISIEIDDGEDDNVDDDYEGQGSNDDNEEMSVENSANVTSAGNNISMVYSGYRPGNKVKFEPGYN